MFPLGESTLALDEEMLQVLDAVDSVKPAACPTTANGGAQEEPASSAAPSRSLAPTAHSKKERDRAPLQPIDDQRSHRSLMTDERLCGRNSDCKRPGWTADCKDLAQKLLFSEDSGEAEQAQRGLSLPASACVSVPQYQEIKNNCQADSFNKSV